MPYSIFLLKRIMTECVLKVPCFLHEGMQRKGRAIIRATIMDFCRAWRTEVGSSLTAGMRLLIEKDMAKTEKIRIDFKF